MLIKNIKIKQSIGVGDTIAKITKTIGIAKITELYTNITGIDCGCAKRQETLNKLFPYGTTTITICKDSLDN